MLISMDSAPTTGSASLSTNNSAQENRCDGGSSGYAGLGANASSDMTTGDGGIDMAGGKSVVDLAASYPLSHATIVFGYITPFVVVISIMTNLFVVVVLTRRHMRTGTNIILCTLAMVDLLTILIGSPWYFYIYTLGHYKDNLNWFTCHSHNVFIEGMPVFLHNASIWLTLFLAGQRYFCIRYPVLACRWCTKPRIKQCIGIIILAAFVSQLSRFFDNEFQFDAQCGQCKQSVANWVHWIGDDLYFGTYFSFRILFVYLLPCIALVSLNCLLYHALKRAERKRTELLGPRHELEEVGWNVTIESSRTLNQSESCCDPAAAAALGQQQQVVSTHLELLHPNEQQHPPLNPFQSDSEDSVDECAAEDADSCRKLKWAEPITRAGKIISNHHHHHHHSKDITNNATLNGSNQPEGVQSKISSSNAQLVDDHDQSGPLDNETIHCAAAAAAANGVPIPSNECPSFASSKGRHLVACHATTTNTGQPLETKLIKNGHHHHQGASSAIIQERKLSLPRHHHLDHDNAADEFKPGPSWKGGRLVSLAGPNNKPEAADGSQTRGCCQKSTSFRVKLRECCWCPLVNLSSSMSGPCSRAKQAAAAGNESTTECMTPCHLEEGQHEEVDEDDDDDEEGRGPRSAVNSFCSNSTSVTSSGQSSSAEMPSSERRPSNLIMLLMQRHHRQSQKISSSNSTNKQATKQAATNHRRLSRLVSNQATQLAASSGVMAMKSMMMTSGNKNANHNSTTTIPANHATAAACASNAPRRRPRRIRDSNRTTLMLIVVVTVYLVIEIPSAVVTTVHIIISVTTEKSFENQFIDDLEAYIKLYSNFLIMLSYSLNFSIYCSMSKKFRITFRDLVTCASLNSNKKQKNSAPNKNNSITNKDFRSPRGAIGTFESKALPNRTSCILVRPRFHSLANNILPTSLNRSNSNRMSQAVSTESYHLNHHKSTTCNNNNKSNFSNQIHHKRPNTMTDII